MRGTARQIRLNFSRSRNSGTREVARASSQAHRRRKRSFDSGLETDQLDFEPMAVPSLRKTPLLEQLRDYQLTAVKFALSQRGVGLFCDPRTGKTWIALAVIEQLEPEDVLIIVPLTNKRTTWVKHISNVLPQYTLCLSMEEFRAAKGHKRILLVHYELLPSIIKKIARLPWGLVVLDESQRIKARASRQSRNLSRLRKVSRRLALSGTPMDDSEMDLWGQMRFIEPRAFGDRWSDFDEAFLRPTGFMGYQRKFRPEMSEEFNRRLRPFCLRVTREDAGIPEPTLHWVPIPLVGRQRVIYDELEKSWIATIGHQKIQSKLEITKRVKLQQIVNGFIFDDDGISHDVGKAKARRLRHLLRRHVKAPAVIFCQYLPELDIIRDVCREFSDSIAVLSGAIKDKGKRRNRSDMIESFQSGEIDYLICQQKTGGVGIDLWKARNAVVYSFNHSYIDFDQMKSRMDLIGEDPPAIFLIYADRTIDEDKKEAVLLKRSITDIVLNRLKRR